MQSSEIRVLLIEDSEPVAAAVQESLMQTRYFELERSKNLTSAVTKIGDSRFDVILLELSLPDSNGIDTVVRVRNACPDTPIVVLTEDENEATGVGAISEGAQDFVTKSTWNPASLPRILRFAVERHKSSRPANVEKNGRVLTFLGAKGGAGTTTVALNVATALAASGRLTIATEWCWPRGNFSLYLSPPPCKNLSAIGTLAPRVISASLLRNLAVASSENLMVLHGPQTASEFAYLNPAQAEAFIHALQQISDFAVIDLPPSPTSVSRAAVRSSDTVCVVLEPTPQSLILANETISMIQSWTVGETLITTLIVNKGTPAVAVSSEDIRSQLHFAPVGIVPPSPEPVPGFSNRIPIAASRRGTMAADSLIEIAERLACKQLQVQPS
jgi:MinD-like ATPase involved in chromosome partitioning or flagellar assembly/ActR/RegA family two-component response regulator